MQASFAPKHKSPIQHNTAEWTICTEKNNIHMDTAKNGKNLLGLLFRWKLTAEEMDGLTWSKQTLAGGAETAAKHILRRPLPEEN